MQVELFCPNCCCSFAAEPNTPAAEVLDRMAEDGPWYALGDGETFEGEEFATYIDSLPDIGPKWRPRYVRVVREFPSTGTNKIVKRTLVRQKYRRDLCGDDDLFVRDRGADSYRPFTDADESTLHAALERAGRGRFWDL